MGWGGRIIFGMPEVLDCEVELLSAIVVSFWIIVDWVKGVVLGNIAG